MFWLVVACCLLVGGVIHHAIIFWMVRLMERRPTCPDWMLIVIFIFRIIYLLGWIMALGVIADGFGVSPADALSKRQNVIIGVAITFAASTLIAYPRFRRTRAAWRLAKQEQKRVGKN